MSHSIMEDGKQVRDKTQYAIKNAKRQAFNEAVDWVAEQLKGHGVTSLLPTGGQVNQEAMRRYGDVSSYEEQRIQREEEAAQRKRELMIRNENLRTGFYEGWRHRAGQPFGLIPRSVREEARKRWPIEGEPPLPPVDSEAKVPEQNVVRPLASGYVPQQGDEVRLAGDEYQKRQRGAFIHGANWAFKYARDLFKMPGYVSTIEAYHAGHGKIVEAAQERFPLAPVKKLRVVEYRYGLSRGNRVYLKYDEDGKVVRTYSDPDCLFVCSPPPLTIQLAETVQDLTTRPHEVK